MKPEIPNERLVRREVEVRETQCMYCGEWFVAKRRHAKFCSKYHRNRGSDLRGQGFSLPFVKRGKKKGGSK